jgi:predicted phage gp36 major capsid-like protein
VADYGDSIGRTNYPTTDPLVPQPLALEIIQEMPKASALLSRARTVPMSTKSLRQPVLSVLPQAYWVTGDTGLKQTTKQMWENITLVAEELATIVVIPDAYIQDTGIPLWDEVKPMIAQALGQKIDQAGIFGVGRPSTWSNSIYELAIAAGNTVGSGTGAGTSGVQSVGITGTPTGGTFTLSFNGAVTAPIAYNANAAAVQAALQALGSIRAGKATVTGGPGPGTAWVVTLDPSLPSATLVGSGAGLTGGASPAVTVNVTTAAVQAGGVDLAQDVVNMGRQLVKNGFALDGFMAAPGFTWELTGLRSTQNVPIYTPSLAGDVPSTLYGRPLSEALNGGWEPNLASLIGGDFSKAVVGLRQDITFKMFDEGVISDDTGKVIVNLMQQDSQAMRVVMRVGFAVANPVTALNPNESTRSPFSVLAPVSDLL